jgi:hypothetical protein
LLAIAATQLVPASASDAAAPHLHLASAHQLSTIPAGGYARYEVSLSNDGTAETSAPITFDFAVPAGLKIASIADELGQEFPEFAAWSCSIAPDGLSATCAGPEFLSEPLPIFPGEEACQTLELTCRFSILLEAEPDATPGTVHPTITACGGSSSACPSVAAGVDDPIEVGPPAEFALTKFDGSILRENGDPATQAGSHPYTASTEFFYTSVLTSQAPEGEELPVEDLKDTEVKLPPGLVENPQAYPRCTETQLSGSGLASECPPESQIGVLTLWLDGHVGSPGNPQRATSALYNMVAAPGTPAMFGTKTEGVAVRFSAVLRSGLDYGITVVSRGAAEVVSFQGVAIELWGVPGDPSHKAERFCPGALKPGCPSAMEANPKPFLTLPTSCLGPGPNNSVQTSIDITSWQTETSDSAGFFSHDNEGNPIGTDGCSNLDFSPTLRARPTTNVADTPSGLDVDLHIPQNESSCDPGPPVTCGVAEAQLKDATVTLPEGLVVNPAGANGLAACSPAQFGLTSALGAPIHTSPDPARCPDASKLGSVEVDTPLVDHPLPGSIYLATPGENPFGSLLAVYIAVDDPRSGIVVKLAGDVESQPKTGRLSASFENAPQLPIENLELHFFGGAAAPLRTPSLCATYRTTSSLTPWSAPDSGPPARPEDAYAIEQPPGGGSCPRSPGALPNALSLDAGTVSPLAGADTPFVFSLRREDGSQQFSAVTFTSPPGLVGELAGIPYCSVSALEEAGGKTGAEEQADPSCPAGSALGTVQVAAGAGPAPYDVRGRVYLTGPYKGAPLGLAIVIPAVAGPFDLGTVVTRAALHVDPADAQLQVVSDPLPSVISGIPLDLRSIGVVFDRPGFIQSPTSCDPMSVAATATTLEGNTAGLSNDFQLGGCGQLGFRPRLALRFSGGTGRNAHPTLTVLLRPRPGNANLRGASVTLPSGELIDPLRLASVCTREEFAAGECPAASRRGWERAWSPLLEAPLEGAVYLRESAGRYPDLVADLDGQFHLAVVAHLHTPGTRIRADFDSLPDIRLSRLELVLEGGKRGLLIDSEGLCRHTRRAAINFVGHNGKARDVRLPVGTACGPRRGRRADHG